LVLACQDSNELVQQSGGQAIQTTCAVDIPRTFIRWNKSGGALGLRRHKHLVFENCQVGQVPAIIELASEGSSPSFYLTPFTRSNGERQARKSVYCYNFLPILHGLKRRLIDYMYIRLRRITHLRRNYLYLSFWVLSIGNTFSPSHPVLSASTLLDIQITCLCYIPDCYLTSLPPHPV
jgi:hypothetical protein